jgi:hypothetical protein
LSGFNPQAVSNIVWAYATAIELHPADVALTKRSNFNPQAIANLLWAYAAIRQTDRHLFLSFAPIVKSNMGELNSQGVANICWAYAVANVDVSSLFNADFISVCLEKGDDFSLEACSQLHQWQLWQEELKSDIKLPPSLREKYWKAFLSPLANPSRLQ